MISSDRSVIQVVISKSQIVTFPVSGCEIRVVSSRRLNREMVFLDFLNSGLVGWTVKRVFRGQNCQRQACVGQRSGRTGRINRLKSYPEIGPPFSRNRRIRWLGGEEFPKIRKFTF